MSIQFLNEERNYAIILLNQSNIFGFGREFFRKLWAQADLRICADGAANQLFSTVHDTTIANDQPVAQIPEFICGDLDSLLPSVGEYYRERGTVVVSDQCQDSTDLEKSIKFLKGQNSDCTQKLVIFGSLSGRFDHSMAILNTLCFQCNSSASQMTYFLDSSDRRQDPQGQHKISTVDGIICGLLPMTPCLVTTEGLQWNLQQSVMQFGGLISSSNRILPGTNSVSISVEPVSVGQEPPPVLLWTCCHISLPS